MGLARQSETGRQEAVQDAGAFPPQLFADFFVVGPTALELLFPFLDRPLDPFKTLGLVEESSPGVSCS